MEKVNRTTPENDYILYKITGVRKIGKIGRESPDAGTT